MTIADVERQRAQYWERRRVAHLERDLTLANTGTDPWHGVTGKTRDNTDFCDRCGATGCDGCNGDDAGGAR